MNTTRTVLLTFTLTVAAIAVAASLFLNAILGVFGLAATSVAAVRNLDATHQIVESMRQRHSDRKREVTRKFASKTGKRVASAAFAAATVGTAAVAVGVVGMEVDDYCDEKKELQKEADILYGTRTEFAADRCFEEATADAKAIFEEVMASVPKVVSDAMDASSRYGAQAWAAVKESSVRAMESTGKAAGELWDSARSWLAE